MPIDPYLPITPKPGKRGPIEIGSFDSGAENPTASGAHVDESEVPADASKKDDESKK